jgi:peptidylprolyl isomerase
MRKARWITLFSLAALILSACQPSAAPASPTAEPLGQPTSQPADAPKGEVTTESGLQYTDLIVGTGDTPQPGDTISVHYTGTLVDGTQFDSSVGGEPIAFQIGVGQVIPGWDEGVGSMKVGGKRLLIIPPELGYGAQGAGDVIPPNATLIFEVELMEILKVKIEDLVEGSGPEVKSGDTIVVHYTGTLEDGTQFDSSVGGQPFTTQIGVGNVIAGWDQGLLGMKAGGKRRLTIPPALGYGARGAGGVIPPNATLIFEVELLEIK